MRKFVINLLFAGASLLGTTAIIACSDPAVAAVPSVAVGYSATELVSPAGRAAIEQRLHRAAARVCTTGNAGAAFAEQACRSEAYAHAARTLGEIVAARTGHGIQFAAR